MEQGPTGRPVAGFPVDPGRSGNTRGWSGAPQPPAGEQGTVQAVSIPWSLAEAMIAHARAEAPLEACGILGGRGGQVLHFYPARNAERSPVRYTVHPEDQLQILLDMERQGEELWGIFHSHPNSEAYPSETDVRYAYYPEAYYVIASLAGPVPVLRAFRIVGGRITEHRIRFEEAQSP